MSSRGGRNAIVARHGQALMYLAVLLQLQLLGAARALVAGSGTGRHLFAAATDCVNGVYHGFIDENGEKQVKYLGKANTTSPGPGALGIGGPGRKLLDSGVHCQGIGQDASDANSATTALANHFGSGNLFYQAIYACVGSAVAYGCDYGTGQTTTSDQILSDAQAISATCGDYAQAGWYGHESWKSSYGRCSSSSSFC